MKENLEDYCLRKSLQWILEQWDYKKNEVLPKELSYGSKVRVWWICEKEHSWDTMAGARVKFEYNCPVCSGQKILTGYNDFATRHPAAMKEWLPELNKDSPDPTKIRVKHAHKATWRCSKGHLWKASYASRASNRGCRYCAGKEIIIGENDLLSQKPQIARYYHKDNKKKASEVFSNETKKYLWNCENCADVFQESPWKLGITSNCANCKKGRSHEEINLYNFCKQLDKDAEFSVRGLVGLWSFDIFLPKYKVLIEYNGVYWHSNKVLLQNTGETAYERHLRKLEECLKEGYELFYVWEDDWNLEKTKIKEEIEKSLISGVKSSILEVLEKG